MSHLPVFQSPEFGSVRVVERDGEPWFAAKEKALTEPKPLPLTPFPRLLTLPKSYRDQLNDLVLAKLSHVPPAFVWKTFSAFLT